MPPGMANRGYRLSPMAEGDLEEIWLYTMDRWSPEQADRYHHDLIATFEALASGGRLGHAVGLRPGYRKQACGTHMIYYRDEDDGWPSSASCMAGRMWIGICRQFVLSSRNCPRPHLR